MFVQSAAMKHHSVLQLIKLLLLECAKCIVVVNLLIFRQCSLSLYLSRLLSYRKSLK